VVTHGTRCRSAEFPQSREQLCRTLDPISRCGTSTTDDEHDVGETSVVVGLDSGARFVGRGWQRDLYRAPDCRRISVDSEAVNVQNS
jgi:hypothetical protein